MESECVEDHQVQMTCAMVPFILLEDARSPRCVIGSLAIKLDILMPFMTLNQSILLMLMELASLTAVHELEHTYGLMLEAYRRRVVILHVLIAVQAIHLYSLVITTTVSQETRIVVLLTTFYMMMTPFGMVKTAA